MSDETPNPSSIGWVGDIEDVTKANTTFRTVVHTAKHLQLTVMSLAVGENIGWEMHDNLDQFLRVESGTGTLKLGRSADDVAEEHAVVRRLGGDHPGGHVARRRQRGRQRAQAVLDLHAARPSAGNRARHQGRCRARRGATTRSTTITPRPPTTTELRRGPRRRSRPSRGGADWWAVATMGPVPQRTPVGHGARGLQRQRRCLELLHPRSGALAGVQVG